LARCSASNDKIIYLAKDGKKIQNKGKIDYRISFLEARWRYSFGSWGKQFQNVILKNVRVVGYVGTITDITEHKKSGSCNFKRQQLSQVVNQSARNILFV
jgi:hypothetical protein